MPPLDLSASLEASTTANLDGSQIEIDPTSSTPAFLTAAFDAYLQKQMSPIICKQKMLYRFEDLANQLAVGWKYHVANTEGIKEAWARFESFYNDVCSFTQGIGRLAIPK
ncbi:Protein-tyrosine phosphatase [Ditylenchus destructor]|nr:Protein-tyrosine phosphatase [Ditylenchus destructor]